MNPLIAMEIINNSIKLGLSVWESMTLEQRQYWLQKGIENDKAFIAWIKSVLKAIGIDA